MEWGKEMVYYKLVMNKLKQVSSPFEIDDRFLSVADAQIFAERLYPELSVEMIYEVNEQSIIKVIYPDK